MTSVFEIFQVRSLARLAFVGLVVVVFVYQRILTRKEVQISVFAHQEMVSVPQSLLTDLPWEENLPFSPPPLPGPFAPFHLSPPRILQRDVGTPGCPGRTPAAAPLLPALRRAWVKAPQGAETCPRRQALLGSCGKRGVWGHTWLALLWQSSLVCALFLCSKKSPWKRPEE